MFYVGYFLLLLFIINIYQLVIDIISIIVVYIYWDIYGVGQVEFQKLLYLEYLIYLFIK